MDCQHLSRILKGLAEPTRLRLACLLAQYDTICVCELTEILELPQYHISRHLGVLRNLGIVVDEREGARVNYRLAEDESPVTDLVTVIAKSVSDCSRAAQDEANAKRLLRGRRRESEG